MDLLTNHLRLLYNWVQRGWVNARQQSVYPHHWIIWADEVEVARLQTHRQRPQGEVLRQRWQGEVPSIRLVRNINKGKKDGRTEFYRSTNHEKSS